MSDVVRETLCGIRTIDDMVAAFSSERRCRRLFEAMVWPNGRVCPACGYRKSIAIAGRDMGRKRARPSLYQCSDSDCRFQFTATTHTPLHSTKLPLGTWLKALWLMLQSDKGLSSVRLAEAIGVSQPTAWRMGHALSLMLAREAPLSGAVEIDEFFMGGRPRQPSGPSKGGGKARGRPVHKRPGTAKTPVLTMAQRPASDEPGTPAGDARAKVVKNLTSSEAEIALADALEPEARLLSDASRAFAAAGDRFSAHETVRHAQREYVRGDVHANSAEGFNSRVRRTIAGVFHHISPQHADLYFHEIGFRWSQRVVARQATRRSRHGPDMLKPVWSRVPPALQLPTALRAAVGRQMRRTQQSGLSVKSKIAAFGL